MKLHATDYTTEEILKILREWTGLTQKDFGKTISRSERSIQSLESGNRHCTAKLSHYIKILTHSVPKVKN